jgi:radical SAM protein with 4Fe4S-binding SPASM domain
LSVEDIKKIVENIGVESINWGTGENILNPAFLDIIKYVYDQKIKMSLTSNGYSIQKLSEEQLLCFHDIDISLDFANVKMNDNMRGPNSYNFAIAAIEKIKKIGVECSFVTCLTKENFGQIRELYNLARSMGVNLRLNVYKPVHNKELSPTYDQFWNCMKTLFDTCNVVSCSEPVILAAQNKLAVYKGCNCGHDSFRVTPDRRIIPCVYWDKSDITIDDLVMYGEKALKNSKEFKKIREIPEFCNSCEFVEYCEGGCAARRLYNNFDEPDLYCFKYQKREKPVINANNRQYKDLIHSGYLCTVIMA